MLCGARTRDEAATDREKAEPELFQLSFRSVKRGVWGEGGGGADLIKKESPAPSWLSFSMEVLPEEWAVCAQSKPLCMPHFGLSHQYQLRLFSHIP